MKFSELRPFFSGLLQYSPRTAWIQILFLLLLVLLFNANVIGLLEFRSGFPGVDLRPGIFTGSSGELRLPPVMVTAEFILLFLVGLLMAALLPLLKPISASLLVSVCTVPFLWLGIGYPLRESLIPMQYSLLVLLMLFGTHVLVNYYIETHKKQKLISIFGHYVPPEIVDRMSQQPEMPNLQGESRVMTVLFTDLKNFTGLSEQMDPRDLITMLNDYFNTMTRILHHHGATIDKFIGDSIMAFWGAPAPQEDHANRAVLAAMDMHFAMNRLTEDYVARGWPGPHMGVGINTGTMNVGHMGSDIRMTYTVIGNAVNLAARLEELTRTYSVDTIVGEATQAANDDILFRELDVVTVRGKSDSSRIFQPLCRRHEASQEQLELIELHQQALAAYHAENFEEARSLFFRLLEASSDDPYYRYMLTKTTLAGEIVTSNSA